MMLVIQGLQVARESGFCGAVERDRLSAALAGDGAEDAESAAAL